MSWCPKCNGEFRDEFESCPQCGVALTEKLEPSEEAVRVQAQAEEMVMIMSFADQQELATACDLLTHGNVPFETRQCQSEEDSSKEEEDLYFGAELYTPKKFARHATALLRFFDKETKKAEYSDDAINDAYEEFMDQNQDASAEKTEKETEKSANGMKILGVLLGLCVALILSLYFFVN